MRKLFFTIPVVLALLVSAVFSVQKAMAATTASWTCVPGGATVTWSGNDLGDDLFVTTAAGTIPIGSAVSGTQTFLNGNGTYTFSAIRARTTVFSSSITCTTTATTTNEPPSSPPFWATDPNGNNRIDADPGEKFAVYCHPGGFVDIWSTASGKPFQFATTTFARFNDIPVSSVISDVALSNNATIRLLGSESISPLTNNVDSGTFTYSKDATGDSITLTQGGNSKTFSLKKCEEQVNYKADPKPNNPKEATYNAKVSAAITEQLEAAKQHLAAAEATGNATKIAVAKADVARWEAMYRPNNTVITENPDGTISFMFPDGAKRDVVKTLVCDPAALASAKARLDAALAALAQAAAAFRAAVNASLFFGTVDDAQLDADVHATSAAAVAAQSDADAAQAVYDSLKKNCP